jgi:hypothetical protein
MALLLQAIEVLEADTTHCSVMIIDTLAEIDKVKIVAFSVAATTLSIGVQELESVVTSRTLYKDRYFVMYQNATPCDAATPLLQPLLNVRVVIHDSEDEGSSTTSRSRSVDVQPLKKSRHGEIRRGKSIKAFNKQLNVTKYFDSQKRFADYIGVGKGAVSACLCLDRKKTIRGWKICHV